MPWMRAPYPSEIRSLTGHVLVATEDEILWVPDEVEPEAVARGWQPSTKPAEAVEAPVQLSDNVTESLDDEDEVDQFEVELDQAVIRVITRNNAADFKKDGVPKLNSVIAEMSPDVKKPTSTQITKSFEKLQDNINLADVE